MSAELLDCYTNIIGLSRSTCNCLGTIPSGTDISESGLYMDELEGMNLDMAKASADCAKGSIWELMDRARSEAIKAFKNDLLAAIGITAKLKRQPWRGYVGDIKYTETFLPGTIVAGTTLFSSNIRSGRIKIKGIGTAFTSTDTFDLKIYNNVSDDPLFTISVESIGNNIKWNVPNTEVILPMSAMGLANVQYWFLYEVNGKVAKNIKTSCGCNGAYQPIWAPSTNQYNWDGVDQRYRWSEFVQAAGAKGPAIETRESSAWTTTEELNGILLDVEFSCNLEETICKEEFDFVSNPLAAGMAAAIRFFADAYLISSILTTKNVNRYTLMSEERLMGTRNRYMKEYTTRINNYLAPMIVDNHLNELSDCFECRDDNGFHKVGIFS